MQGNSVAGSTFIDMFNDDPICAECGDYYHSSDLHEVGIDTSSRRKKDLVCSTCLSNIHESLIIEND